MNQIERDFIGLREEIRDLRNYFLRHNPIVAADMGRWLLALSRIEAEVARLTQELEGPRHL